jgi:putative ABC transport system substrate-binding protein
MTIHIGRREFISAIGGAAVAWPLAALAQQPMKVARVRFFQAGGAQSKALQDEFQAFRQKLEDLGWHEGKNLQLDNPPLTPDLPAISAVVVETIALKPDVVVTGTSLAIAQIERNAPDLTVVFYAITDPVSQGFVQSLGHPGRNATGFAAYEFSLGGKWVSLLKQIAPDVSRAAFLYQQGNAPYIGGMIGSITPAAVSVGITLVDSSFKNGDELVDVIASFAKLPNGGLIIPPGPWLFAFGEKIVALAAQYSLPAIYGQPLVASGGLISYGADRVEQARGAASYVDRILKGAKAADLPVQNPTKYDLLINLKTAKALRLTIPPALFALADEVIE